jgi:hypothetical protein
MFFSSLNPDIRRAMILGVVIVFGGGAIAVSGLIWAFASTGSANPRIAVACICMAFLTWVITAIRMRNE